MAMLASMTAVVPKETLFCLHVDHGLRPAEESRADAEFVRSFCEREEIACTVESIPSGKIASFARRRGTGIEAAARFFRRRALFRKAAQLGENALILTAHTKDDSLELALMRVLRGSGPAGLAVMPVSRGRLLRPLLEISRAEVIEYLSEKKIPWREDATNKDEKFLRNRLRHQLVPLLNESFPAWKSGLLGMAQTQSLASAFIACEAQNRVVWESREDRLCTDEKNFFAQAQIIREEAVFQGIDALLKGSSCPMPRRAVVRGFCETAVKAADLGAVRIRRKGGKILLSRAGLLIKEPPLYKLKKKGEDN